jgi:hypothetical protein
VSNSVPVDECSDEFAHLIEVWRAERLDDHRRTLTHQGYCPLIHAAHNAGGRARGPAL